MEAYFRCKMAILRQAGRAVPSAFTDAAALKLWKLV
jgi:hypothetical protein